MFSVASSTVDVCRLLLCAVNIGGHDRIKATMQRFMSSKMLVQKFDCGDAATSERGQLLCRWPS